MAKSKIKVTAQLLATLRPALRGFVTVTNYKAKLEEREKSIRAKVEQIAPEIFALNGRESGEIAPGVNVAVVHDVQIDPAKAYEAVLEQPVLHGMMFRVPQAAVPTVAGLIYKVNQAVEDLQAGNITADEFAGMFAKTGQIDLTTVFDLNTAAYKGSAAEYNLPIEGVTKKLQTRVNMTALVDAVEGSEWFEVVEPVEAEF